MVELHACKPANYRQHTLNYELHRSVGRSLSCYYMGILGSLRRYALNKLPRRKQHGIIGVQDSQATDRRESFGRFALGFSRRPLSYLRSHVCLQC